MTYQFVSVVPKVLHKAFDGIFNARFLIKNVEQNKKNVKKRKKRGKNKNVKKTFFYIYEENNLARPVWEENFRISLFKMAHSGVIYILSDGATPNVAGPEQTSLQSFDRPNHTL